MGLLTDFLDKRRIHTGKQLWLTNDYSGSEGDCQVLVPHTFLEYACVTKLLVSEIQVAMQCYTLTTREDPAMVIDYKWSRSFAICYTVDRTASLGFYALSFSLHRLHAPLKKAVQTYKKGMLAEREQICDELTRVRGQYPVAATIDVGYALVQRVRHEFFVEANPPNFGTRDRTLISSAWFWTTLGECRFANTSVSQPISQDPGSGLGALLGVPGRRFAFVSPHRLLIPRPQEMVSRVPA
jgi:hypothetical protein